MGARSYSRNWQREMVVSYDHFCTLLFRVVLRVVVGVSGGRDECVQFAVCTGALCQTCTHARTKTIARVCALHAHSLQ